MQHFPLTLQESTPENIAQDMNSFIESLTGLNVGFEIVGNYTTFCGWYDGREFDISVNNTSSLKDIQKYVYDNCVEWNCN